MKKIIFTILISLIAVAPTSILVALVYPAFRNSEDMFMGLNGAVIAAAALYAPMFALQLTVGVSLRFLLFPQKKTPAQIWISSSLLFAGTMLLAGYCVFLGTRN